eukprot:10642233-Karenia_brevis.AAC.1
MGIPLTNTSDYIIWDARSLNSVADHAANAALDLGNFWERVDDLELTRSRAAFANFRVCVDGAMRSEGQASGGMAILAYYAT